MAGGILSFLAVGNLVSCVVYPLMCRRMSEKMAVVLLALLSPLFIFSSGSRRGQLEAGFEDAVGICHFDCSLLSAAGFWQSA